MVDMLRSVVALLLTSCACMSCTHRDPPPAVESATGTQRLLALGDSFTIGTGSSPDEAFPARLAERWDRGGCHFEVRNVAVNGYTSRNVIDRELPELSPFAPTWITVAVGANDLVQSVSESTYRQNVRTILSAATRAVPKEHVLVLPQPDWPRTNVGSSFGITSADVDRFDTILREEAVAVGARFVDLKALMRAEADAKMVAEDGLHPNAAAHEAWAEKIASLAPGC